MKKVEETNLVNLPHIKRYNLAAIARKADVDHSYVYKILAGDRLAKSAKAKAILLAAEKINAAIEKNLNALQTETQNVD